MVQNYDLDLVGLHALQSLFDKTIYARIYI